MTREYSMHLQREREIKEKAEKLAKGETLKPLEPGEQLAHQQQFRHDFFAEKIYNLQIEFDQQFPNKLYQRDFANVLERAQRHDDYYQQHQMPGAYQSIAEAIREDKILTDKIWMPVFNYKREMYQYARIGDLFVQQRSKKFNLRNMTIQPYRPIIAPLIELTRDLNTDKADGTCSVMSTFLTANDKKYGTMAASNLEATIATYVPALEKLGYQDTDSILSVIRQQTAIMVEKEREKFIVPFAKEIAASPDRCYRIQVDNQFQLYINAINKELRGVESSVLQLILTCL